MPKYALALVVAAALLALHAPVKAADVEKTGTVSGVVTAPDGKPVLAGIKVHLHHKHLRAVRDHDHDADDKAEFVTETKSDGSYSIEVPLGAYEVVVHDKGVGRGKAHARVTAADPKVTANVTLHKHPATQPVK